MSSRFPRTARVSRARPLARAVAAVLLIACGCAHAAEFQFPDPYAGKKKVLIIGDIHTGAQIAHDGVSHAMATLEHLGRESGAYVAFIRTDTQLLTKAEVFGSGDYARGGSKQARGRNLDYFDAVVFYTNGSPPMTAEQKRDLLSFVHDDGKGIIGGHSAIDSNYKWAEYGEMMGAYFDQHPWGQFMAPIIIEDPNFPAMRDFPKTFLMMDEIYQPSKEFSRDKVRVLARLDENKLDLTNKNVHRTDKDFAVAWIKTYGKGRVFYSTFGHRDEVYDRPDVQHMYLEATKWAMRLTDYDPTPRPRP